MRYGGNTSCVEFRRGSELVVLDAGTGLRVLGRHLLREYRRKPLHMTLLLSHTHWDHIQGLPYFGPIYEPRCRLRIVGGEGARMSLEAALAGQMESTYFPVPFSELPSNIHITEQKDPRFAIGEIKVQVFRANHPGEAVGYRLTTPEGSVVYLPDAEPKRGGEDRDLMEFVQGADVLILDSQYDLKEYRRHVGWGHGCVDDSVALAAAAGVKKLFLFHHDPDHDDRKMDEMVRCARRLAVRSGSRLKVDAAREGVSVNFG